MPIKLKDDAQIRKTKPATSTRDGLQRHVKPGLAYTLSEVADALSVSEKTVETHAKDLGMFRYMKIDTFLWEPRIFHPETAKKFDA